jgi:hypothetical protein
MRVPQAQQFGLLPAPLLKILPEEEPDQSHHRAFVFRGGLRGRVPQVRCHRDQDAVLPGRILPRGSPEGPNQQRTSTVILDFVGFCTQPGRERRPVKRHDHLALS